MRKVKESNKVEGDSGWAMWVRWWGSPLRSWHLIKEGGDNIPGKGNSKAGGPEAGASLVQKDCP